MTDLAAHYLDEIKHQLRAYKRLAETAMLQLSDEQVFATVGPEANSVAVIVKHIAGNARSRFTDFLTSDGEKPDRFRDQEFEMSANTTREELMRQWEQGWATVLGAVDSLAPADVLRTITIREEPHTVLQALNRALAHYVQHVGQIVFLAKYLCGVEWKTLSIARGKSEGYKAVKPGGERVRGAMRA